MGLNPNLIEVNQITDFNTYLRSIDYTDPLILGLVSFHLGTLVTILLTRRYTNFQIFLFLILLSMVYFSESINEIAAAKWNLFTRQQYFDSDGMFLSIVFSMPILINCILLIGLWLYESTQTMARLKCVQARHKARVESETQNDKEKTS